MPFRAKQARLRFDATRVFGVQFAVLLQRAPPGCDAFSTRPTRLLRRMGSDPGKDAGGDRASDGGMVKSRQRTTGPRY